MSNKRRVVITAPDVTSAGYSGFGMRATGIAGALANYGHDVSLLVEGVPAEFPDTEADVIATTEAKRSAVGQADVIITSNALRLRQLVGLRAAVVSDLYDPSYFEWLVLEEEGRRERREWMRRELGVLRRAVRTSDVVLCANSRQRDLYLGALLAGAPRETLLDTGGRRRGVEDRVLVVSNGIAAGEPLPRRGEARARLGLGEDELVLLWGGGVWDWLDVATVVDAVKGAHQRNSRVKLVFLGLRRHDEPDPHARRAFDLLSAYIGDDLGSPIRVNEQWVTPAGRLDYLAAADAGVLGQYDNLETHFSFRTRLIDCLQAGLPVVTMSGDELSEQATAEGWGLASRCGDVDGMRDHVLSLAGDPDRVERMRRQARNKAQEMTWDRLCRPLAGVLESLARPSSRKRLERAAFLTPSLVDTANSQLQAKLWSRARGECR